MVGGLLQLTAKGAQDIYLTGNPQITFFKIVYRRHTNFSIESALQTFDGAASDGGTITSTIARKGDLLYKIYIEQKIPTGIPFTETLKNYGYDFIKEVSLRIGGQLIDRHTNNWLETYAEITQPNEYGNFSSAHNALFMNSAPNIGPGHTFGNNVSHTATKFQSMTMAGGVDSYKFINHFTNSTVDNTIPSDKTPIIIPNKQQVTPYYTSTLIKDDSSSLAPFYYLTTDSDNENKIAINDYAEYLYNNEHHYIYTPLQFWFCRNIGLALPLIALQYNEVDVEIRIKKLINNNIILELYADYIFLDTDERRRFAQISHEYLIEQIQIRNGSSEEIHQISFKNQVKELIWVRGDGKKADYDGPLLGKWYIQINGYDRFSPRDISYFTKQQINDYHTGYGGVTERNSIAVYSFCLNPEDHQPSGTINLSSINNFNLVCVPRDSEDISSQHITIYAVNYNVLRIIAGQGKLAYTN
uniref:Major capsid protein N-terminal domain-containing protein n=1 Tax=viral metagenome TaxID=1070528 RepID=A0A6C0C6V6_9ZZZZ